MTAEEAERLAKRLDYNSGGNSQNVFGAAATAIRALLQQVQTVLEREAATVKRHDDKLDKLERERDALAEHDPISAAAVYALHQKLKEAERERDRALGERDAIIADTKAMISTAVAKAERERDEALAVLRRAAEINPYGNVENAKVRDDARAILAKHDGGRDG